MGFDNSKYSTMARPKTKQPETLGLSSDPEYSQHQLEEIKLRARPKRVRKLHPFGPATSSLKPLAQKFVETMLTHANLGQARALKIAGHKGSDVAVNQAAYRLMKNAIVLEALKEGAAAHLTGMVPKATKALDHVISDPHSRHHFKAIDGILNRAGLPEIKEHKTTVVHKVDRKELVASIATMVERLGIPLDPSKFCRSQW